MTKSICQKNESEKTHNAAGLETRQKILECARHLFNRYGMANAMGLVKPEFCGKVREETMLILTYSHIAWLKLSMRQNDPIAVTRQKLLDAHWTVLSCWLTPAGLRELKEMQNVLPDTI